MSDIIIGISLIRMGDVTSSTNNKHSILQFMKEYNNKSKITNKKSTSNKSNNQSVKINT